MVGAIGLVCAGAVITGSNVSPLLIGGTTRKFRTSVGHLENKSENKEPSRSDSAWRPSISWRHRNARARAYAVEQEVFGDFEADIGSTVAELFAPFGDAEPWRDALGAQHRSRCRSTRHAASNIHSHEKAEPRCSSGRRHPKSSKRCRCHSRPPRKKSARSSGPCDTSRGESCDARRGGCDGTSN